MAKKREKMLKNMTINKSQKKEWNPLLDPNAQGSNPRKSIFVSRLNYRVDENRLYKEFEVFGPVQSVHIVRHTKTGKSKGYAFVEFRHREDADNAMRADGRRIDGMRYIVDRELGRTNVDWAPRRFGGGKGEKRRDRDEEDFVR